MKEKYFDWVKILGTIGVFLALYLLLEQLFHPAFQPCNVSSTVNCNATITGPLAKTLGIPTPLIGLMGYLIILFAAFKKKSGLVLGMSVFGLAFCLYIAFREIVQLHVVCPVCVGCQLDMITVFVLGIIINLRPKNLPPPA